MGTVRRGGVKPIRGTGRKITPAEARRMIAVEERKGQGMLLRRMASMGKKGAKRNP